jgi:PTH1 family peptidyl-tRNA hydrolase
MAQLIIGLGNPGGEYANTRHNVGWMCLEELERRGRFGRDRREGPARIREGSLEGFDVVLARPQTYMNLSGRAGSHLCRVFGQAPADVLVVHDDMDLPLGRLRLRRGGSAGGQNGVKSLIETWRTQEFMRVRIGVGRPPVRDQDEIVDFLLTRFTPDERAVLAQAVPRAADSVLAVLRSGLDEAMNQFNRRPDAAPEPGPEADG